MPEYCLKFGIHRHTVRSKIKFNIMPSNHIAKKVSRNWVIDVVDNNTINADAIREYIRKCGIIRPDIAAELSIKYGINTAKFFRDLGI